MSWTILKISDCDLQVKLARFQNYKLARLQNFSSTFKIEPF